LKSERGRKEGSKATRAGCAARGAARVTATCSKMRHATAAAAGAAAD